MSRSRDGQSNVVSPSASKWKPPAASEIETLALKSPVATVPLVPGQSEKSGVSTKPALPPSTAESQPEECPSFGVSDSGSLGVGSWCFVQGTREGQEPVATPGVTASPDSDTGPDEDSTCSITSLLQSPVNFGEPPRHRARPTGKSHFTSLARAAQSSEQKSPASTYEDIDLSTPVDACTTSLLEPKERHLGDSPGTPEDFRASGRPAPTFSRRLPAQPRPAPRSTVGYFSCFLPWSCAVGGGVHSQGYQTGSTSPEDEDSSPEERGCYRWRGSWMGTEAPTSSFESAPGMLQRQGSDAPSTRSKPGPTPPDLSSSLSGAAGTEGKVGQGQICSSSGLPAPVKNSPRKVCSASGDVKCLKTVGDESCTSGWRNCDFVEPGTNVVENMLPSEDLSREVSSSASKVSLPFSCSSHLRENISSHRAQKPDRDTTDCAVVVPGENNAESLPFQPESCSFTTTGAAREGPRTTAGYPSSQSEMEPKCTDFERKDSLMDLVQGDRTSDRGSASVAMGEREFSDPGKGPSNHQMESKPGDRKSRVQRQNPEESRCSTGEPIQVALNSGGNLPQSSRIPDNSRQIHESCSQCAPGCRETSTDSGCWGQDSRQAPQCCRQPPSQDSSHTGSGQAPRNSGQPQTQNSSRAGQNARQAPWSSRQLPVQNSSPTTAESLHDTPSCMQQLSQGSGLPGQDPTHDPQSSPQQSHGDFPLLDPLEHLQPQPDSTEPLPENSEPSGKSKPLSKVSGQVSAESTADHIETRPPSHQGRSPIKSPPHPRSRRGRRCFLRSVRHRRQQLSAMSSSEEDWNQLFSMHRGPGGSATSGNRLPRALHLRQNAPGTESMEAGGDENPCTSQGTGMPCEGGDNPTPGCCIPSASGDWMSSSGSLADMSSADTPTKTTFNDDDDDEDSSSLLGDGSSCSVHGDDVTFDLSGEEDIAMLSDNPTVATACPCCYDNTANSTGSQSISADYPGCYDNLGMDTDSESQPLETAMPGQQPTCKEEETGGDLEAGVGHPGDLELKGFSERDGVNVDGGLEKSSGRLSDQGQPKGSVDSVAEVLMMFDPVSREDERRQTCGASKQSLTSNPASDLCSDSAGISSGSFPAAESSSRRLSESGDTSTSPRGSRPNRQEPMVLSDAEVAEFVSQKLRLSHSEDKESSCMDKESSCSNNWSQGDRAAKGCNVKSSVYDVNGEDQSKKTHCPMKSQSSLDAAAWKEESLGRKVQSVEDMCTEDCSSTTDPSHGLRPGRSCSRATPLSTKTTQREDLASLCSRRNKTANPSDAHPGAVGAELLGSSFESPQTRSSMDFIPSTDLGLGDDAEQPPTVSSRGRFCTPDTREGDSGRLVCPSGGTPAPDASQQVAESKEVHPSTPSHLGVPVASRVGERRRELEETGTLPQEEPNVSRVASLAETLTGLPSALLNLRPITVMALRQFNTTTTPSRHRGSRGGGGFRPIQPMRVDLLAQQLMQGDPSTAVGVRHPRAFDSRNQLLRQASEETLPLAQARAGVSSLRERLGSIEKPANGTSFVWKQPNRETSCLMEVDGSEANSRNFSSTCENAAAGHENQDKRFSGNRVLERTDPNPPAQAFQASHSNSLNGDPSQDMQGETSGDVGRNSGAREVRNMDDQSPSGMESSSGTVNSSGTANVSRYGASASATSSDVNSGLDLFSRHGGNAAMAREQMRNRLASKNEADQAHFSRALRGRSRKPKREDMPERPRRGGTLTGEDALEMPQSARMTEEGGTGTPRRNGASTEGDATERARRRSGTSAEEDAGERPRRNYMSRLGGLNSLLTFSSPRMSPPLTTSRASQNGGVSRADSEVPSDPDASSQPPSQTSSLQDADSVLGVARRLLRRHGYTSNVAAPSEAVSDSGSEDGRSEDEDSYSADDEFDCDCEACARLRHLQVDGERLTPTPVGSYREPGMPPAEPRQSRLYPSTTDTLGLLLPEYGIETDMLQRIIGFTGNARFVGGLPVFDSPVEQDIGSVDVVPQWLADELIWNSLPPVGLSEGAIAHLPVCAAAEGEEGSTCVICQQEVLEGEMLIRLPCLHCFHQLCLRHWLSRAASCPICRRKVE